MNKRNFKRKKRATVRNGGVVPRVSQVTKKGMPGPKLRRNNYASHGRNESCSEWCNDIDVYTNLNNCTMLTHQLSQSFIVGKTLV